MSDMGETGFREVPQTISASHRIMNTQGLDAWKDGSISDNYRGVLLRSIPCVLV